MSQEGAATADSTERRLELAAVSARAAEARGDGWAANAAWNRYRLIADSTRDPDDLLAEGIALSKQAARLAAQA